MDLNKILDEVIFNENVYIDTAQSYGGVEELIGKFAPKKFLKRWKNTNMLSFFDKIQDFFVKCELLFIFPPKTNRKGKL